MWCTMLTDVFGVNPERQQVLASGTAIILRGYRANSPQAEPRRPMLHATVGGVAADTRLSSLSLRPRYCAPVGDAPMWHSVPTSVAGHRYSRSKYDDGRQRY